MWIYVKRYIYASFLVLALVLLSMQVIGVSNPYWYDTSWHFRVNYTVNNSNYDRNFWPLEFDINFTDFIYQKNKDGTFDNESIRVIEHNSSGNVLFEHSFQFDEVSDFNITTNAAGTITLILNGTTYANQARYIYVYFDIVENTAKTPVTYSRITSSITGNLVKSSRKYCSSGIP